ncbi:MAG: nucleotidyl transferase AbiEii/AbiGii toxin family protein, partial [Xanthomonadales bacterium]|nr:nucleotidyl transferase AbiEii/AbiGii toxin family protein [Xanthomonadales bacterium]
GCLHPPCLMPVQASVEELFGYGEVPVVSLPDLYGGKLCAALDRQHPRDLFDVHGLLQEGGISRAIFSGFLCYLLGHPRPMNEIMAPRWQALEERFHKEFEGMTRVPVALDVLLRTRQAMLSALQTQFTEQDRAFLLSFKQGEPDWDLFDHPTIAHLPAVQWKLLNIKRLAKNKGKHGALLNKLRDVLDDWLS